MRQLTMLATALLATAALAQPASGHYYGLVDDGMYGYEAARVGNEAGSPLMMVGFNGSKADTLQLMQLQHPNTVYVLQCQQPCDYYKMMEFRGSKFVDVLTMRTREGSRAWMAFQDAAAGKLKRYVDRRQPKRPMHVWCTQADGCEASPAPR